MYVCTGICDCCDGSDEWWGEMRCENVCEELGRKADAERREQEAIQAQGYEKKIQYEQQGIRSVSHSHTQAHTHTQCTHIDIHIHLS